MPAFAKGKRAKDPRVSGPAATESRETEARRACLEGDYAKGVSIMVSLFLETKDPAYIFNQGRCYEQSERYPEAISRFREYIRTGTEQTALAEKHIAECEMLEARKHPAPAAQPIPATTTAPPQQLPVAVESASRADAQPSSSGGGLRIAGIIVASAGAAGLATGLVLNLRANSMAKDIEPPNTYRRSTESSRKTYETLSWVGYGIGAAGLVTGTILYLVGRSQNSQAEVAVHPAIGSGMAGATVCGAF